MLRRHQRMLARLGVAVLLFAAGPPTQAAPAGGMDIMIVGGTLIDMVADEPAPTPVRALIVRDGRLARVVPGGSDEPLPADLPTIDAAGMFILPGFFDAHVHFRPWLPDASIWKRAGNYYGITSLFDTGPCGDRCAETGRDPNEWIAAYKQFMNTAPVADGPTLYMTGRRIQDLDGTHPLGVKLASRGEIADYLDSLVELGVDGVKVESTLPPDLRAAVVSEAGARGLPVVGHSRDANESIAAGMRFIEHMWPITSSLASADPGGKFNSPQHDHLLDLGRAATLIASLVANEVYVNPTLVGRYGYFVPSLAPEAGIDFAAFEYGGLFSDMPDADKDGVRAWWRRAADWDDARRQQHLDGYARVQEFLRRFSEAGGRILIATDSGEDKLVGIGLHREMRLLAEAGVPPYRILLGATRWPAEMARKDGEIGSLAAGKHADIVIVGADPLADIRNSLDIRYVIKRGNVVRHADDCSVIRPPIATTCRH